MEQAAARKGVAVDDESLTLAPNLDGELQAATLARLRNEALVRKLVLASLKPDEKKRVFGLFADDLAGYRLSYLVLQADSSQSALLQDLRSGMPFRLLSLKYGRQHPPELTKDWLAVLRPEELLKRFGASGSEQILHTKVGQFTRPLECLLGMVLVRVDAVEKSEDDLMPQVEKVLLEAHKTEFLQQLGEDSAVSTPLQWSALERVRTVIEGEKPAQLARPKPSKQVAVATVAPPPERRKQTPPTPLKPFKPFKLSQPPAQRGPFRAHLQTTSHRFIPFLWNNSRVLCLDLNDNHHVDPGEPFLVKIGLSGWELVADLSESLDRFSFSKDYGLWTDEALSHTEGMPWDRKQVLDQPPDGLVQAHEVVLKSFRQASRLGQFNRWELGLEVERDEQGRLTAFEQTADFGRLQPSKQDQDQLEVYVEGDGDWHVASHGSGI